jgi:molybdate transport system substrate-binding protein
MRHRFRTTIGSVFAAIALLAGTGTRASEITVAVASNFAAPMRIIAQDFTRLTGHQVRLSFAATGQFHAQIRHGAPFAVLLSADALTPEQLEREGLGVAGSRFTYATGRLALWSPRIGTVDPAGRVLQTGFVERIALANPRTAPYGAAARQVLVRLGLEEQLSGRIVEAMSIAQVYQFVASGNAAMGFVSLAQIYRDGVIARGAAWIVPESLHEPIRQDAILLQPGRNHAAAIALLAHLRSPATRELIRSFGYETPAEQP